MYDRFSASCNLSLLPHHQTNSWDFFATFTCIFSSSMSMWCARTWSAEEVSVLKAKNLEVNATGFVSNFIINIALMVLTVTRYQNF